MTQGGGDMTINGDTNIAKRYEKKTENREEE